MATVDREDWAAGLRGAIPKCRWSDGWPN